MRVAGAGCAGCVNTRKCAQNGCKGSKTPQNAKLNVVLAGNPNAGKTTLFNALTKSSLRTGNFHGVTTDWYKKEVNGIVYTDSPGLYSFSAYSMEELAAAGQIEEADVIVNVVDALTLESALNLTRKLISLNKPVIVYITKTGQLKKRGGRLDASLLSTYLGVPVFTCPPKKLKSEIERGTGRAVARKNMPLSAAYSAGNEGLSRADKLFYNRYFALICFVFAIISMFFLAFHPAMPGAVLKDLTEGLIVDKLGGFVASKIPSAPLSSLIAEGVLGGAGSVLSFIPQLAVLYLFLTLLDESGITSSLAFATDGLFEKVNLSGRAAFSLISGFGCTAAAIMTTRGYSTESAQKRTIAVLPYIPCGAKLPVFLTFLSPLFKNPFPAICILYFAAVAIALTVSLILKGKGENMLSEVTPVCLPQPSTVIKKLYFYLKGFIIKVAVTVTAFCIASWFLSHYSFSLEYVPANSSMLAAISRLVSPLFYPMGATDWRLAYAALCGFIAKENIAATIAMLMPAGTGLDMSGALAISVFVLLSPACISAFSASCKEAGFAFTLKCFLLQLAFAFACGYAVHLIPL